MDAFSCFALLLCILISLGMIVLLISMDSLEPLQYGITYNKFTKTIGTEVFESGRYFIGPLKSFIVYPANLVTIEFSNLRRAMVFILIILEFSFANKNSRRSSDFVTCILSI